MFTALSFWCLLLTSLILSVLFNMTLVQHHTPDLRPESIVHYVCKDSSSCGYLKRFLPLIIFSIMPLV
ncbi:hypothetical protein M758_8G167000 [Ceratodon purpureus]|nr:hypothetical protein M758_8G167000 [Ceratodon purpureus]